MSRVGIIGVGHIGAPIARFLVNKGHQVTVTERSHAVSRKLAAEHGVSVGTAQEVLDQSDIVLICIRPHQADPVLAPLTFRSSQRVVSVMAGAPLRLLETLCAPVESLVLTIPLGFLETGGCPLPALGDHTLLAELFSPENPVIPVRDEQALNTHLALCAMVPGMLDLMTTGAEWLADRTGDRDGAERYAAQLIAGFFGAIPQGAGRMAAERDALTVPGSYSLQMTETLRAEGAHKALTTALHSIGERLKQQ